MNTSEAASSTLPPRCTARLGVWSTLAYAAMCCKAVHKTNTRRNGSKNSEKSKQQRRALTSDFGGSALEVRLTSRGHANVSQIVCIITPLCNSTAPRHPKYFTSWLANIGAMRFPMGIPVDAMAVTVFRFFPKLV